MTLTNSEKGEQAMTVYHAEFKIQSEMRPTFDDS